VRKSEAGEEEIGEAKEETGEIKESESNAD